MDQKIAFATGVPPISTHFTTTPGVPSSSLPLWFVVERPLLPPFSINLPNRLHALRPVNPDNARLLRFTAAAGT